MQVILNPKSATLAGDARWKWSPPCHSRDAALGRQARAPTATLTLTLTPTLTLTLSPYQTFGGVRLMALGRLVEAWQAPVSAAIYISNWEVIWYQIRSPQWSSILSCN